MDTNTGESPGHQSQSQQLGNSPSEEEMGHWAPTGVESKVYDAYDASECDLAIVYRTFQLNRAYAMVFWHKRQHIKFCTCQKILY